MPRPNWHNAEDYTFCRTLDRNGWVWEFLRRNQDFVSDYYRAKSVMDRARKKHGPWSKNRRKDSPHPFIYKPSRLPGESLSDWRRRAIKSGYQPKRMTPLRQFADDWLLATIQSPTKNSPPKFQSRFPFRIREVEHLDPLIVSIWGEDPRVGDQYLVVALDLGAENIASQVEKLKEIAAEAITALSERDTSPKRKEARQSRNWEEHLRILDALHAEPGINPVELYDGLHPRDEHNPNEGPTDRQKRDDVHNKIAAAQLMTAQYHRYL